MKGTNKIIQDLDLLTIMESVRKVNVLTEIIFKKNKNLPLEKEQFQKLTVTKDDEGVLKYPKEIYPSSRPEGNDFTLQDF